MSLTLALTDNAFSYTLLVDTDAADDKKKQMSIACGVVTHELCSDLLLMNHKVAGAVGCFFESDKKEEKEEQPEQEQDTVAVLTITWLHTNESFLGHKYGSMLLYLLVVFAQDNYNVKYIVLDDMTDTPAAAGNLFYLIGFKRRSPHHHHHHHHWQPWPYIDEETTGPERLISTADFMSARYNQRLQPFLKTLLATVTLTLPLP